MVCVKLPCAVTYQEVGAAEVVDRGQWSAFPSQARPSLTMAALRSASPAIAIAKPRYMIGRDARLGNMAFSTLCSSAAHAMARLYGQLISQAACGRG